MKPKKVTKFRATPVDIRSGKTAPYFVIEPDSRAKKDEVEKVANQHFLQHSALAKYNEWQLSIEKM